MQKILLHREGAEVNKSDLGLHATLDDLYAIIAQHDHENVYNMDETGLFFCLLPRYNLLMPNEDISTSRGKEKKSKDRVSLIVCANAVGTHKKPCAKRKKHLPVARTANGMFHISVKLKLGWMWKRAGSGSTKCFFHELKKRTGCRVLLLLDNAPGHFEAFERDYVRIVFFPPNCTSWKQPCDMGIIAPLKKRFKYLYLKDVLDFYELDEEAKLRKKMQVRRLRRGAAGVAYKNPAHLLDAASYVKEAWQYLCHQAL